MPTDELEELLQAILEDEERREKGKDAFVSREDTKRIVEEECCPPHPGSMHGVCIRCGKNVEDEEEQRRWERNKKRRWQEEEDQGMHEVKLSYIREGFRVSKAEAERVKLLERQRMRNLKKLYLVLDLDHTLLNSSKYAEIDLQTKEKLDVLMMEQDERAASSKKGSRPELFDLKPIRIWTKIRPGAYDFLEKASELFELHVYTMGHKLYAAEMAKLLDPSGRLFNGHIISQQDSSSEAKKDLDIVLGEPSEVCIVDDSPSVWTRHEFNVLQVGRDEGIEEVQGGQLTATWRTLRAAHHAVFVTDLAIIDSNPLGDVREQLRRLRMKILKGVTILFTRIWPETEKHPQMHPLWRMATGAGAECRTSLSQDVTHVVSGGSTTEKVKWARKHNKHVVTPDWIERSVQMWKKLNESEFEISKKPYIPWRGRTLEHQLHNTKPEGPGSDQPQVSSWSSPRTEGHKESSGNIANMVEEDVEIDL